MLNYEWTPKEKENEEKINMYYLKFSSSVMFSSLVVVPAASAAGVFGLLYRQHEGRYEPGLETCPDPAESGSAHPPSETPPTAGASDPGLQVNNKLGLTG